MKKILVNGIITLMLICSMSCGFLKTAEVVLVDGVFTKTYDEYDNPIIKGKLENIGDGTAYRTQIMIRLMNNNTIVAEDWIYPSGSTIPPGVDVTFSKTYNYGFEEHSDYNKIEYFIDYIQAYELEDDEDDDE